MALRGKTGLLSGSCEGRGVETVRLWVVEQAARDRMLYERTQDLLGVEPAARLEHSLDLAERPSPLRYVMDDAEVEDGIVGRRGDRNGGRVGHPEANP